MCNMGGDIEVSSDTDTTDDSGQILREDLAVAGPDGAIVDRESHHSLVPKGPELQAFTSEGRGSGQRDQSRSVDEVDLGEAEANDGDHQHPRSGLQSPASDMEEALRQISELPRMIQHFHDGYNQLLRELAQRFGSHDTDILRVLGKTVEEGERSYRTNRDLKRRLEASEAKVERLEREMGELKLALGVRGFPRAPTLPVEDEARERRPGARRVMGVPDMPAQAHIEQREEGPGDLSRISGNRPSSRKRRKVDYSPQAVKEYYEHGWGSEGWVYEPQRKWPGFGYS